ncbi:Crp/Fnr family transcriptional regulator [Hydrogenophaga sp. RWCD_12]|uniref:Crp/Fnr family transcriptional regulator n=1 Tax=Hydrogenophaga sp. RWCD_12 TaxID=3391190 RepID=UPI0039854762
MNPPSNGLLAQLPPADLALLLRCCTPVTLRAGQVLCSPDGPSDRVHFPTSASVALVARPGAHAGLAVGLAGCEGAVGLQQAFGLGSGTLTQLVQSPGTALQFTGGELQRLVNRHAGMLKVFSRYIWLFSQEVAMLAASAQVQDIKARLAGWILLSAQRAPQTPLVLTHAHLADMLGVRRAGVTLAAMALKEQGLLDYRRGRIRILDQAGLAAEACHMPGIAAGTGDQPIAAVDE